MNASTAVLCAAGESRREGGLQNFDGVDLSGFEAGRTYDVPAVLANDLVITNVAEFAFGDRADTDGADGISAGQTR